MRKMELQTKIELAQMDMDEIVEKNRVENLVYQKRLVEWYKERKVLFERDRFLESHTAEERSKIISYRNRNAEFERLKKQKEREAYLEKARRLPLN